MSSLSPKDRVSLCSFTFSDGRRCRTPRAANHPRFCFYHAQKEARARAARKLGKDLDYFFSGDYLSACDLSTALGHLIPAVIRCDVKPRVAHTVAYLAQTLMQAIHVSQDEYINTFGTDGWRKSICNSVNHNYNYRFPPAPKPVQPPSPPSGPVEAGLQPGSSSSSTGTGSNLTQPTPASQAQSLRKSPEPIASQPAATPANYHSACPCPVGERSEESASSSNPSLATHHFLKPHNQPHRRTLRCLPRGPNLFNM